MNIRENISDLSSSELEKLICAMKKLKDNGQWDTFVDTHAENMDYVHHDYQQFLPWHRIFILKFEEKLRSIDSSVELPYWRWIGTRKIPDGFEQELFGWMGVTRALTHDGDGLPTSSQVEDVMAETSFSSFSNKLEVLHDQVHVWVGGSMADPMTSAKDPLFWFHHAYCDKLLERWILSKDMIAFRPWDLHDPYSSYDMNEVKDGTKLGYQYTDMAY